MAHKFLRVLLLLCPCLPALAYGQGEETLAAIDTRPVSCISLSGLHKVQVVDPTTLAFIRRRQVYLNTMRHICPGMAPGGTFSFRMHGGRIKRLCRGDPVYPNWVAGMSCTLGNFHEISAAQAKVMLNPVEAWALDNTVTSKSVELPEHSRTAD
jgi:hypothetical protein